MITLAEKFPDIAAQWDFERNGDLTPDKIHHGSHLKVWWKCPNPNHPPYRQKVQVVAAWLSAETYAKLKVVVRVMIGITK